MNIFMRCLMGLMCVAVLQSASAGPIKTPRILKPVAGNNARFMFVAYGDTRSHPDDHRAVIGAIVKLHPEFVLQSGDLVARGGNAADWIEFAGITRPLSQAGIGYYPARGNHDVGPYYVHTVMEPFDSGNKYYYAFTRHGNRFIIADSMDPEEFVPSSTQYRWLERELKKAQGTAVNTFVMFHEGPYSVGPHGPTPDAQRWLQPLFVRYKPRAVFCGHDHLYYHTERDGVTYLVTGGGGAPLYEAVNKQVAIAGDVYASVHHVIRCDVDGARVTFTVLALDGSAVPLRGPRPVVTRVLTPGKVVSHAVASEPGGTVIDRFTLGPK